MTGVQTCALPISEVFDEHITDIKVIVPKLVTSDGDQNAPKELFKEAPKPEVSNGSQ